MRDKGEMTEHHQRPAYAACLQVGQGQRDRINEWAARFQHRFTLQPAAVAQAHEVDCDAGCSQPEVRADEELRWPLTAGHAWHDEVDGTEEHHGDKSIQAQMRVAYRMVREM